MSFEMLQAYIRDMFIYIKNLYLIHKYNKSCKVFDYELKHRLFTDDNIIDYISETYKNESYAVLNPVAVVMFVIGKLDKNYSRFMINGVEFEKNSDKSISEKYILKIKTSKPGYFIGKSGKTFDRIKKELEKEFKTTIYIDLKETH